MIKEFCDRCKTEIKKDKKKNISFDCGYATVGFFSGKIDMTVCLDCHKDIKEFTKTIPVGRRK